RRMRPPIARRVPARATVPCRLFVYLARTAPLAVVLRRGPSAWTQLSLWHTDTDTFQHGQWFRGRVYEQRCALSPDGALFVAFARKGPVRPRPAAAADSWVAGSRPPYFTALALWFGGSTYPPGGYFTATGELFVGGTAAPDQGKLPAWLALTRDV